MDSGEELGDGLVIPFLRKGNLEVNVTPGSSGCSFTTVLPRRRSKASNSLEFRRYLI
jgi:hypothetical protein